MSSRMSARDAVAEEMLRYLNSRGELYVEKEPDIHSAYIDGRVDMTALADAAITALLRAADDEPEAAKEKT